MFNSVLKEQRKAKESRLLIDHVTPDTNWFVNERCLKYYDIEYLIHKTKEYKDTWLLSCLNYDLSNHDLMTDNSMTAYNEALKIIEYYYYNGFDRDTKKSRNKKHLLKTKNKKHLLKTKNNKVKTNVNNGKTKGNYFKIVLNNVKDRFNLSKVS